MALDSNEKVQLFWSQYEPDRDGAGFYSSGIVRGYIISNAFGAEFVDSYANNPHYSEDMLVDRYLKGKNIRTVLSLCCGFGSVEQRVVSRLENVDHCLGIDLAEGALDSARDRARKSGLDSIEYVKADLNTYDWPLEKYDLIIANGALHHLSNLEGVIAGMHHSLKPGGTLFCCEYVGAKLQDQPPRQLELINACSYLIPQELRTRHPVPFTAGCLFEFTSRLLSVCNREIDSAWPKWKKAIFNIVKALFHPNPDTFRFGVVHISRRRFLEKNDPSEGVRSDEILPILTAKFLNAKVLPMGGGILQHALDSNFYKRFDPGNTVHVTCFELLCNIERMYMNLNVLGPENVFIIAEKS